MNNLVTPNQPLKVMTNEDSFTLEIINGYLIEKLMHFENQSIMSVLPSIDTKDNDM
jgi:hypothetical protein